MIVEPDFLDHWKVNALAARIGRLEAITALLSLWAHCQQRRAWRFPLSELMLAGVCRFTGNPRVLVDTLLELNLLEKVDETTVEVHEWADTNAKLVHNWTVGKTGGRPPKQPKGKPTENPRVNPAETRGQTRGQTDKIREEGTPIVPRGDDDDDELSLDGDAAERSDSADSETVPAAKKKRGGGGAALMEAAGRVYELYPRKVGRDKALRAIVKRLEAGVELEVLMEATGAYAEAVKRWPAEDRVYVPHAASWFNAGGYDDDRREWVRGEAAGPAAAAAPAAVGAMTSGGGGGDGPEGWMQVMDELYGDAWRDGWVPRWWELVASQRRAVLERMKGGAA